MNTQHWQGFQLSHLQGCATLLPERKKYIQRYSDHTQNYNIWTSHLAFFLVSPFPLQFMDQPLLLSVTTVFLKGSVLFLTLFLIFINDIFSWTNNRIHLHADASLCTPFLSHPCLNCLLLTITTIKSKLDRIFQRGHHNLVNLDAYKP